MTHRGARVLVADDEQSILQYLKDLLADEGYTVFAVSNGEEACTTAERESVHLALIDLMMPDLSGMEVLKRIKDRMPSTQVMIMTAFATVSTALDAMKNGALDYLIKPFPTEELKLQIRRALDETALSKENLALRQEVERGARGRGLLGESPVFVKALDLVRKIAAGDTVVFILGETGTGKEMVAREIHRLSSRSSGPFLAVNCGALPENLLERELFGNEKGAFTGADATRPGLLEAAADGTLLLDEIVEMPPSLQVKLLRVIEGHEFLRIGGTRPIKNRVRFLAATNRDPEAAVKAGILREDLYFRLNVMPVCLPPLRERGDDVILVAESFVRLFSGEKGKKAGTLTEDALRLLRQYRWPGNVRELRNLMERAVILCEGPEIGIEHLNLPVRDASPAPDSPKWMEMPYRDAKKEFESSYLKRALEAAGGNISRASTATGIDRTNLKEKLRQYGIKPGK